MASRSPESPKRLRVGWKRHVSVWWTNLGSVVASPRIAAFDLDGTLIDTKSGKKFPTDRHDWRFFGASGLNTGVVKRRLAKAVADGFKIVIITNQKGVSLGLYSIDEITGKLEDMHRQLGIPIQAFILTEGDQYRKPVPAVWDFMASECNDGIAVDLSSSYYVGDAAGRPADGRIKKKKDHSATDLKFALNVGMQFRTPENYFFGHVDSSIPSVFPFNPKHIGLEDSVAPTAKPSVGERKELVILVGPPGSGKTTVARNLFSSYTHINQDTLKTKEKCLKACDDSLAEGNSCVVDNQNRDRATRKAYIDAAEKHGASVRAVYMDVPKDLCFHLNAYRMLNPRIPEHRKQKVPPMVIHSFFKYVQPPDTSEGFCHIETITLPTFRAGPFENAEDEKLFRMFLE